MAAMTESPPVRMKSDGQIETEEEYNTRMAKNAYMRFSRSLKRSLGAKHVCMYIM